MDDETQLGGWVPTEQTRPGRDDARPLAERFQAPSVRELVVAPRVVPAGPRRAPRSGSAARSIRVSGRLPQKPPTLPWRSRLSTVRRLVRPSSWHRPARLGSGPLRTSRLLLARHRRPLAGCLALVGVWITVRSAAPPPAATQTILLAAHDLPAGRTLTSDDVRTGSWPAAQIPLGRLSTAAGRVLAAPIRGGEPLTDARVVGPGLLAGQTPGTVAVPVRLGEAAAGSLVRAGDRVDVLASATASTISSTWTDQSDGTGTGTTGTTGGAADSSASDGSGVERVAASALVLAVPGAGSADATGWSGSAGTGLGGLTGSSASGSGPGAVSTPGVLVLAVSSDEARKLAAAQAGRHLGIAVLPQP
jgi:Flp pilus assembly protein CpaB